MARHVPSRDRDNPVNNAGDLPSHRPHTQEYNFSFNEEASVPRSSAPLYVSRTGTRVSHALQDHRSPTLIGRTSHGDDNGENYTFEASPSGDTEAALARALRSLTLGDGEDEATTHYNGKLAYGHNSMEQGASGHIIGGLNSTEDGTRGSGIGIVAVTQRHRLDRDDQSGIPKTSTSISLHTKEAENVHLDGTADALGAVRGSLDTQHRDQEPALNPGGQKSGKAEERFLDDNALADTTYRRSCFLGLGTWPSADAEAPAETPKSSAGSLSVSDIDSTSPLCSKFKSSFTQCGAGGSGSSSSRGQGKQSSSETFNTFRSNQCQGSGSRKDKRPSGAGGDQDGDDDPGSKRFKGDEISPKIPSRRFACPFQKHDPADVSYDGTKGKYRSCTGVGFPTIARLKEHLYRCHLNGFTCPRCQNNFPEQEMMDDHLRKEERCEQSEQMPKTTSGITPAVEKKLRRKTMVQDPEAKWWEIYRLIFPSESLPSSPYYRPDGSGDFNEYAERHMLEALDISLDPMLDNWTGTPEQRACLKNTIAKCHKQLWDAFLVSKEAEKTTPCDWNGKAGQLEDLPEIPPSVANLGGIQWRLLDFGSQRNIQVETAAYSDPVLSTPFSHGQPPPLPREGLAPVYGRPIGPQRVPSYWSDSGVGSSSHCDQCSDGKCGRCLVPTTPASWNNPESLHAARNMPGGLNAALEFDHVYDPNQEPFLFAPTSQNVEEILGLEIQNYCGQHPDVQTPQRWSQ